MRITVRFFAILKDRAGVPEMSLDLPLDATVSVAVAMISERFPAIKSDLKRTALALNRSYEKPETILHDGDELALIPPVSGG